MGRRRAHRAVLVGMVAATATACGFLYDPDRLGSAVCVDCDASRGDVQVSVPDTGSDADAPDASGARGCRYLGSVTFCRDFDDGAPFDTDFTQWVSQGGILSNSADSYSPPRSFMASIPAGGAGGVRRAYMHRVFNGAVAGGGPTDIRFAANIQIESAPSDELVPVVTVFFGDPSVTDQRYISLELGRDRASVIEQQQSGPMIEYPFPSGRTPPVGPGVWPRIEVRIDANLPHLWVSLDTGTGPVTVLDRALASSGWAIPRPPELHIGIGEMLPASSAWQVRYDDIVFDLK